MLTEVRLRRNASEFFPLTFEPDPDGLFVKSIDGLGAEQDVLITDSNFIPGGVFLNASGKQRNIVIQFGIAPSLVAAGTIRNELLNYCYVGSTLDLEFYSDHMVPVKTSGVVETFEPDIFSDDPSITVSVVCKDAYFYALQRTVFALDQTSPGSIVIPYEGDVPNGFQFKTTLIPNTEGPSLNWRLQAPAQDPSNVGLYWQSAAGNYYGGNQVLTTETTKGVRSQRLTVYTADVSSNINPTSYWPELYPGDNNFVTSYTTGNVKFGDFSWIAKYGGL